jgi:tRNA modification GTPase
VTGTGIDDIQRALAEATLGGAPFGGAEPLVDSERQRDLLTSALASLKRLRASLSEGATPDLLAVDCAEAMDSLEEITGAVTNAEVLDRMFSRFCVGK